jgi:outer membrane receptor for ferrienterochelin and colicin
LWRLDIASELLFLGDAGTTEPSRSSRRQGIEWANYFKPTSALTVDFDLTLSRSRFKDADPAGNFIPGATDRTLSGGAVYSDGPWSGGLRVRYFGPRALTEDNSQRSSSSTLVNAKLGYAASKTVKLGVEVLNLMDRKVDDIAYFYVSRLPGEPAGGVADRHFHPTQPRTVRLTLVLQL